MESLFDFLSNSCGEPQGDSTFYSVNNTLWRSEDAGDLAFPPLQVSPVVFPKVRQCDLQQAVSCSTSIQQTDSSSLLMANRVLSAGSVLWLEQNLALQLCVITVNWNEPGGSSAYYDGFTAFFMFKHADCRVYGSISCSLFTGWTDWWVETHTCRCVFPRWVRVRAHGKDVASSAGCLPSYANVCKLQGKNNLLQKIK